MHLKIKNKTDLYKFIEEKILDTNMSSYDYLCESLQTLKEGSLKTIHNYFDLELQDINRRLIIGINKNIDLDVISDNIESLMIISTVRLAIKEHNRSIHRIDELLTKFY